MTQPKPITDLTEVERVFKIYAKQSMPPPFLEALQNLIQAARVDEVKKALMIVRVHSMDKPNDIYKVLDDRLATLNSEDGVQR